MGFVRRMETTGKVEIPEAAKKEAELMFLHDIIVRGLRRGAQYPTNSRDESWPNTA